MSGAQGSSDQQMPDEVRTALHKAVFWEWFTLAYTAFTVTSVAFVVGNSQSMKTAWIEDMFSTLPQIGFLVALPFTRRTASKGHPFGHHRAMSVGHLVAGIALLAVGINLVYDAVTGLVGREHPTIGTVDLFGHTIWLGWLMVAIMAVIVVGPVFLYGPAKARIAPLLNNKLLAADADMAKADWQTNAASIVGVLGIGLGLWWLDGAAAIFISIGIIRDGYANTRTALADLMDQRALTYDDDTVHPLMDEVLGRLRTLGWVEQAAIRLRDMGQVLHLEIFVVPASPDVGLTEIEEATEAAAEVDWKIEDVVVTLCRELPLEADEGTRADTSEG